MTDSPFDEKIVARRRREFSRSWAQLHAFCRGILGQMDFFGDSLSERLLAENQLRRRPVDAFGIADAHEMVREIRLVAARDLELVVEAAGHGDDFDDARKCAR